MEPVLGPFGRYRLVERLGAGGMAEVFRAVLDGPQGFARTVVLKRILPNLAHDEGFLRLFLDEARISAVLHHPGIVQVNDFGAIDGTYFLAMELVEGWTLGKLLQLCKQRLTAVPVADVCYAMSELLGALAYAHAVSDESGRALEIVHRDVSPSNIMVTKQGGVKLLDFGIARAAEHVRDERTRHGTRKGKLSYMSPEQTSAATVDRRSDIFSIGIVFHEWLTMRRLFKRDSDVQTVLAIREEPIAPPSLHRTGIPPELDAMVLRMLAREPHDRYASCDDVLTELVPLMQQLRGHAQSLRAFVGKLEAPVSDTAETVPMPKLTDAPSAEATVLAKVTPADQWQEPTRPMALHPAVTQPMPRVAAPAGSLAPGVVAFHRPRHWWRRLHPDRRVVLAAGGVVIAVALTIVTIAFVAWPKSVPVPHAALPAAMSNEPAAEPVAAEPVAAEPVAAERVRADPEPATAPARPDIRATPLVEPPRPPHKAHRRSRGRNAVH